MSSANLAKSDRLFSGDDRIERFFSWYSSPKFIVVHEVEPLSTIIQADYDQLAAIAGRFSAESAAIRRLRQRMVLNVQHVREGAWVGEGADSFVAELEHELLPALQRLADGLTEGASVTRQISDCIWEAEQRAAALFVGEAIAPLEGGPRGLQSRPPQTPPPQDGWWDSFWRSFPGQAGLALFNGATAFVVGSGHEVGASYGAAAEAGSFAGEVSSSFLVVGDVRDLLVEGFKALHPTMDADELTAVVAAAGLLADSGWLDGLIPDPIDGANASLAMLKALVKQIDELPQPALKRVRGMVAWGIKNPDKLDEVADLTQWMLKEVDTPLGQGMGRVLQRALADPHWYDKAFEMLPLIRKDPERFLALATEKGGKIDQTTFNETLVALNVERIAQEIDDVATLKVTPPFTRAASEAWDYTDAAGIKWDIKSYNSRYPDGFVLEEVERMLRKEIGGKHEYILFDMTDLTDPDQVKQLKELVKENEWEDYVEWYYPIKGD